MFEFKRSATYNYHKYIQVAICKPHGNPKPKIFNRYTHKKRRDPNKTLKMVIKSHRKRAKEEINKQKPYKNNQKTINKLAINKWLSILTLKVNGLNTLVKTRMAEWIHKQDADICCLQDTHFR